MFKVCEKFNKILSSTTFLLWLILITLIILVIKIDNLSNNLEYISGNSDAIMNNSWRITHQLEAIHNKKWTIDEYNNSVSGVDDLSQYIWKQYQRR